MAYYCFLVGLLMTTFWAHFQIIDRVQSSYRVILALFTVLIPVLVLLYAFHGPLTQKTEGCASNQRDSC